jgi:hypothetical protein
VKVGGFDCYSRRPPKLKNKEGQMSLSLGSPTIQNRAGISDPDLTLVTEFKKSNFYSIWPQPKTADFRALFCSYVANKWLITRLNS